MTRIRSIDTNTFAYSIDTRFPTISIKLLETRETHAHASVIMAQVQPGAEIPRHVHAAEVETAFVLSGTGKLMSATDEIHFSMGVLATIPAGVEHWVINDGDQPLVIFAFHTPPTR